MICRLFTKQRFGRIRMLLSCQTVNVGGDSAVSRIMVTGQETEECIITASKVTAHSPGVIPPENLVYQYVDITLAGCPFNSSFQLEFEVPLSYVENFRSTVDDIRLYQPGTSPGSVCRQLPGEVRMVSPFIVEIARNSPVMPLSCLTEPMSPQEKVHLVLYLPHQ